MAAADYTGDKILILDYGSQFTQLIARKIREIGVYCEILPYNTGVDSFAKFAPAGVILSGGPQSVLQEGAPQMHPALAGYTQPVLGLCYGMQLLMYDGGGRVTPAQAGGRREYGEATMRITRRDCPLFEGVVGAGGAGDTSTVWMSHGDHVETPANGFYTAAVSGDNTICAVADDTRRRYGLQFHPEVAHTQCGAQLLQNFAYRVCGLRAQWSMPDFIAQAVSDIQRQVGDEHVLLALSGGVDSAVTAMLLHRAIGERLVCVFIDNGLLRQDEAESVRRVFERQFGMKLIVIDAAARFYEALAGVADPEEKRRRIGHVFIELFEQQARQLGGQVNWLAQGTIYPDVVESAKTGAGKDVIKTHHNVGGLPERLQLKLIEPLRDLFKDEVRRLGEAMGLEKDLMWRHPFPGPGLAVRVLGEVTPAGVAKARAADKIYMDELRAAGAYYDVAQAFAVLLPVNTVGVMGDARTYDNVIALRAVATDDFMTADWARLDSTLLARVSTRIINEVSGVNRVVYDISSKPPATIEWE